MKKVTHLLALFFITGIVFTSCQKAKEEAIDDTDMIQASAMIDMNYELDFSSGADQSAQNNSYQSDIPEQNFNPPACATITVETASDGGFPRTFTVDFGEGCDYNGFVRSGILVITLSDYFINPGSIMTISRENYVVNNWAIEGTVTFTNVTTDANIPSWTRSIANGKFTDPDGVIYTHSGTRTVRQLEGYSTITLDDNVYEVSSGTHHLTRSDGRTLSVTILSPIIKAMSCDYISEGVMHIEGGLLNGDINYGDGACDNQAVYTHHNGLTFKMNL